MPISFFERLQLVIAIKKISQKRLSELLGVDQGTVSRWRKKPPSMSNVVKICEIIGCDLRWLSDGIGSPFPSKIQQARVGYAALLDRGTDPGSILGMPSREESQASTEQGIESAEPERGMIRMYRQLAQMDADTFGEIQTWINDMERIRPGFTGWFRIEFQNRFPEFDEWKNKILKKSPDENNQNGPMGLKSANGH